MCDYAGSGAMLVLLERERIGPNRKLEMKQPRAKSKATESIVCYITCNVRNGNYLMHIILPKLPHHPLKIPRNHLADSNMFLTALTQPQRSCRIDYLGKFIATLILRKALTI